jgi:hypothetical protein
VAVFLPRIITDDEAHALDIFRQHKHKHVPVRRSVVMRLGNTDAENADFFPVQLGANARPKAGEIALRVRRAGSVPFAVTVARFSCGVIFRRRGQV